MKRPPASLKVRALQWLAQREYSGLEMRDKLLRLLRQQDRLADDSGAAGTDSAPEGLAEPPVPAAAVDEVLAWLTQHGHLSEARFAESRVHARQSRFGNRRIQQELKQHGVALDAGAAQALADSEYARACEVWRRRYGQVATDAAGRARQARFLVGRGFSLEVVQRLVRRGAADEGAGSAP